MPFLAVPFSDRETKQKLSEKFGVSGIPTLILLNGKGEIITKEGRGIVSSHGATGFPYSTERISQLEKVQRDKMENLPKKVKINEHEHELDLLPKVYQGAYGCDLCGEGGSGFAYHCDKCGFDIHPSCAKPI